MTDTIDGATVVGFNPIILRGDPGAAGAAGSPGATGATPSLTIGTVTTVPSGQSASASLSGTAANPVLNLVLPAGPTGTSGAGSATNFVTWDGIAAQPSRPVTPSGVPAIWISPSQPSGGGTVGGATGAVDGLDIWIRTP